MISKPTHALSVEADTTKAKMPPIRTSRNAKPPPTGFDDIEDTLLEFSNKMKDAENASHEGKKRHEVLWPIFQINHQRTWTFLPIFVGPETGIFSSQKSAYT